MNGKSWRPPGPEQQKGPMRNQQPAAPAGKGSRGAARPLILVAEDDLSVRGPLEKFLALHGFDAVCADTADAALDRLAEKPVQGAVIDLRLRQGSGREVVIAIPPPIPVIIFSAVPHESGQLEQMRPNTRLILKPFSLVMLVETLQSMIEAAARKEPATRRISAPAG